MSLYPLRVTFGEAHHAMVIVITRDGWKFATPGDRDRFTAMPVGARLEYRKAFAAQVELAKNTPV